MQAPPSPSPDDSEHVPAGDPARARQRASTDLPSTSASDSDDGLADAPARADASTAETPPGPGVEPTASAPPAGSSSHLARGLALAAALSACVATPQLLQQIMDGKPQLLTMFALVLGAAMVALLTRLPLARTLRSLALIVYGALVLGIVATVLLLFGSINVSLLDADVLVLAVASLLSWLGAVALNRWEARRAFVTARRLDIVRSVGWAVTIALCLPPLAWQLGMGLLMSLGPVWQGTPAEGLAGGLALAAGLAVLAVAGVVAVWFQRLLARLQLRGALMASAASESLWFAALLSVTGAQLVAWQVWSVALLPQHAAPWTASLAGAGWLGTSARDSDLMSMLVRGDASNVAELAIRLMMIITAHGATRLLLGRPSASPPVPLLVLIPTATPSPALRRFIARLPGLWPNGPMTRLSWPKDALHDSGAHLQAAQRIGAADWLFVRHAAGADAYLQALPPPPLWRALPVREAYVGADDWPLALRRWVTPHTWVLWLGEADPGNTMALVNGERIQPWLPPGRSVTVNVGASTVPRPEYIGASSRRSLAGLPAWHGDRAESFAAWLHQRAQPASPRRILVLYDTAQTLLADRLTQRLSGRYDADGRFVEAAPLGGSSVVRSMGLPLWVAATMIQAAGSAPRDPRFASLRLAERYLRLLGHLAKPSPDAIRLDYDVVLLRATREGNRPPEPLLPAVLAGAGQRVAVVLDHGAEAPTACEGRIDAMAVGRGDDAGQLEELVSRLLAGAWLRVGAEPTASDRKPAGEEAQQLAGLDAVATTGSAAPASNAAGAIPDLDMMLICLGVSDLRLRTLQDLLTQRLPTTVRWALRDSDDTDGQAWLSGTAAGGVVLITAAQRPVSQEALDAVLKTALAAGRTVWRAPMAVDNDLALPSSLERMPADWNANDAVPGPNLPMWADALTADLTQHQSGSGPAPRSPDALCLVNTGEPDALVVGRRDGWLRWGAVLKHEHHSDVRALLALADGRMASVDQGALHLWQGRSPPMRFVLPRAPRTLAELRDENGHLLIVAATPGRALLVVSPDETDPALAVREIALKTAVESVTAFSPEAGWVATAGPGGLQLVHAGNGATRVLDTGHSGQQVRVVAGHGAWLFYGGLDPDGNGLVGLHRGRPQTASPIELSGLAARITALCPMDSEDVLFGDAAGAVWRWMPGRGANQAQQIATVSGAVQAIVCSPRGAVTALAGARLFGCGQRDGDATDSA